MNMEIFDFMELANKAIENNLEERIWQRWLSERPIMAMNEEFIPYEDYKNKILIPSKQISQKRTEDILQEAENITKAIKGCGK